MNYSLLICFVACFCIKICLAECDNLQDVCPTATTEQQTFFINGFPCKNPTKIIASDFKTSKLSVAGDTDNYLRSAMTIVTAADFPGLNTLGLSIARTDLEVDGLITPHSHPRASEMFFVGKGVVIAGFLDTSNQLFQKTLKTGDVFVVPQGLLHFCWNTGYESAVIYSVLNSQNPGVVTIAGAMFEPDSNAIKQLTKKLIPLCKLEDNENENVTPAAYPSHFSL